MIVLLLKASIIIAMLLAFYKIFLEKESFFATNRVYLIGCIIFAFTLPFVSIPQLVQEQGFVTSFVESYTDDKNNTPVELTTKVGESLTQKETKTVLPTTEKNVEQTTAKIENQVEATPNRGLLDWLLIAYYFGVVILRVQIKYTIQVELSSIIQLFRSLVLFLITFLSILKAMIMIPTNKSSLTKESM